MHPRALVSARTRASQPGPLRSSESPSAVRRAHARSLPLPSPICQRAYFGTLLSVYRIGVSLSTPQPRTLSSRNGTAKGMTGPRRSSAFGPRAGWLGMPPPTAQRHEPPPCRLGGSTSASIPALARAVKTPPGIRPRKRASAAPPRGRKAFRTAPWRTARLRRRSACRTMPPSGRRRAEAVNAAAAGDTNTHGSDGGTRRQQAPGRSELERHLHPNRAAR